MEEREPGDSGPAPPPAECAMEQSTTFSSMSAAKLPHGSATASRPPSWHEEAAPPTPYLGGKPFPCPAALWNAILRRKQLWQLVVTVLWGSIAVYIHASSDMSQLFFDDDDGNQTLRRLVWWFVAVPLYVYLAVYFIRFLGSFLLRSWVQEMLQSQSLRRALIRMGGALLEDERTLEIVAELCQQKAVVNGASGLVAKVTSTPEVHQAVAGLVVAVLTEPRVQEAAAEASGALLRNPRVPGDVQALLEREEVARLAAAQVAQLLRHEQVRVAGAELVQYLLDDQLVRDVMHSRVISFAQDKHIFEAGFGGAAGALQGTFGPRCCQGATL